MKIGTLDFARFPKPRYTRLSRRCTSVRIILSSRRFSSVKRVSMRERAGLYCWASSCLSGDARQLTEGVQVGNVIKDSDSKDVSG